MTTTTDQKLDEIQWRAPEWIQMFGLRTDNVLEYFAQSPFYDRTSNNQVLKMQSQFNDSLHSRPDLMSELKGMQGVEFVIYLAQEPHLWIIRKQDRLSPQDVRLLATYFVVGENIYMAPSIYSIVNSRLMSTTLALREALDTAGKLPNYSPSQGYSYISEAASLTADSSQQTSTTNTASNTPSARRPGKSNHPTPAPGQTPASQQNQNINNSIQIPAVNDFKSMLYMERALAYTNANGTKYLDAADVDLKPNVPLDAVSRVNTPNVVASPGLQKRVAVAAAAAGPRKR